MYRPDLRVVLAVSSMAALTGLPACAPGQERSSSPDCTAEALAGPAGRAAESLGEDNIYTVDTVNCADDWAVTAGLLASQDNPDMGAPTSFIFRRQDDRWAYQDKAAVCGTDPVTTTPPADAKIPAALFVSGCAAG